MAGSGGEALGPPGRDRHWICGVDDHLVQTVSRERRGLSDEGAQLPALGIGQHRPRLGVIDDDRAKVGQVRDSRHIYVEVHALLDRPRLGHFVHPESVLGDMVNKPEVAASRLGAKPERRGPEDREHVRIDGVDAEILEADCTACSHGPTLAEVIIFSWNRGCPRQAVIIEGVAASGTSVFISRIRGLPVLDSAGDQVGKVRDVVVQRRAAGRAPRVKGLVVELFARHRVFMPMARVRSIDGFAVVISGVVNTRRFERRESEMLVIDDLFDLTVERIDHQGPSVIFDVAMQPVRSHDWELSQVALREAGSRRRFGRRGHVTIVDWSTIALLASDRGQGTDQLLAQMEDMKPADIARELHEMSRERRAEVASALDDHKLADALEELPEDEQVQLISELDTERAADILEEMDPDDAADLIAELAPEMAEVLLGRMEPEEAKDVRRLLSYAESTAGGMMTPEPVILPPDATVAEALARIRDAELTPALACMVYVCRPPLDTPTGRFVGAVHFQRLLREPPSTLVSALIDTDLETLTDQANLHDVSRYFATYNLVNAPVVDADHRLIGAIAVDDVLDHMLPEDWRGIELDAVSAHQSPDTGVTAHG
jgi:flagellar motility protein MotE (MotC chaperone)/sporulation protein YlmC with PRC-barrel domain